MHNFLKFLWESVEKKVKHLAGSILCSDSIYIQTTLRAFNTDKIILEDLPHYLPVQNYRPVCIFR